MYPNLSYFLHDVFGTPVDNWTSVFNTFGMFLAFALFSAGYVLKRVFQLQEKEGVLSYKVEEEVIGKPPSITEYISNGLFGFLLFFKGAYIWSNGEEFVNNAANVILSKKGDFLMGILGLVLFTVYFWWKSNKDKPDKITTKKIKVYPHNRVGEIIVVAGLSGVFGSKLFSVLEDIPSLINDPVHQFLSGSGLNIYGGLIVGFIVVFFYVKKHGIKPIHVMDAAAPSIMAGYAVGRMGCHFSGDGDWGIVNTKAIPDWFFLPDWVWSYDYPRNVNNAGVKMTDCIGKYCSHLPEGVWPTPIYEIIVSGLIVLVLFYLLKKIKTPGIVFFIFMILNGIERFFIEKIRVNEIHSFLGIKMTQAEFISIGFILVGIIGVFVLKYNSKKSQVK